MISNVVLCSKSFDISSQHSDIQSVKVPISIVHISSKILLSNVCICNKSSHIKSLHIQQKFCYQLFVYAIKVPISKAFISSKSFEIKCLYVIVLISTVCYKVYVLLSNVCISSKVLISNVCMRVYSSKLCPNEEIHCSGVSQSGFLFTITSWNCFNPIIKTQEYEQNNMLYNYKIQIHLELGYILRNGKHTAPPDIK